MKCIKCGKEIDSGDYSADSGLCKKCFGNILNELKLFEFNPSAEPKVYQQGWVCPKCGRVMSPTQPYCLFCCSCQNTPVSITTTWSSSDTNIQT